MISGTSLPSGIFARRLAAVRAVLADRGCAGLVAFCGPRICGGGGLVHWLAGWTPLRAPSILVLPPTGAPVVLAGGPNERRVMAATLGKRGRAGNVSEAATAFAELSGTGPIATVGVAQMSVEPSRLLKEFCPDQIALDAPLDVLRLSAEPQAIDLHRRGAEISAAMIRVAMTAFRRPDATPADILIETEFCGRQLGADFATLWLAIGETPPVTCFEMSELPKAIGPRDRIQLGTTLSVDGHYAQLLRTGARDGGTLALRKRLQELVDLQDAALACVEIGAPLYQLSDVLEQGIDRLCPKYTHQTDPFRFQSCHVLGVDYAEPAARSALDPMRDRAGDADPVRIAPGMVIEIHPNFTDPELGHVCTGDMALATETGPVWLGDMQRGLIALD